MLAGRFHEVSLATRDIRASVEFYERLGFSQAVTTDAWPHLYGVLTDGRLYIGLHQRSGLSPALTFVRPDIPGLRDELATHGIVPAFCRTGDEVFNELGFRDPTGQPVAVVEARTYSPAQRDPAALSHCGYFSELSIPATDLAKAAGFWESLGFVALDERDAPYLHLPLVSDGLDITFHRPRTLDRPMLVFRDPEMPARIGRLRESGVALSDELPAGLDPAGNALLESPEGTALLLLQDEG